MEREKSEIKIRPKLLEDINRILVVIPEAIHKGLWTEDLKKYYGLVASHLGYIIDKNGKPFVDSFYHLFKSDKDYLFIVNKLLRLRYIKFAGREVLPLALRKQREAAYKNVKQHMKPTVWIADKNKFAPLIIELQTKGYFKIDVPTWVEIKRIFDNSFGDTIGQVTAKIKIASNTPSIPEHTPSKL